MFQDYVRFELPAYENVAYGALHRRDDRAGVAEAARPRRAAIVERLPRRLVDAAQRASSTGGTSSRAASGSGSRSRGRCSRCAAARAC